MNGTKGALWTLGLVFFVAFATQIVAAGLNVFEMDVATWQAAANSAIMAVLAFAINAVSPWIPRYGIRMKKENA